MFLICKLSHGPLLRDGGELEPRGMQDDFASRSRRKKKKSRSRAGASSAIEPIARDPSGLLDELAGGFDLRPIDRPLGDSEPAGRASGRRGV